jgi:lysophospholipase L1-like esterase
MEGVNDLNGGRGVTATANAMEDLVRSARARGVRVLLSTIPRINPLGTKHLDSAPLVVPFNAALASIAAAKDATLVDIYPHITLEMLAPDGLHLVEAGNQKLAELYLQALQMFEVLVGGAGL